jgi:hypothetical protein
MGLASHALADLILQFALILTPLASNFAGLLYARSQCRCLPILRDSRL